MDKELIKRQITELVNDFRANEQKHRKEGEANTETKLVEPLFSILGWENKDFEKQKSAHREDKSGRADYAFKLGDKIVFLVEVKKVGISLEKEADKQVVSYALSKMNVPFAISTNFEQLKIFCVEQENPVSNVFWVFEEPEEYIKNLEILLYLHRESFEQNLLLKKAEDQGRLKKRISIDKALLEDLMKMRNMIANDIEKRYPKEYEMNEREEIIQRIINRLIFIRKCEDVEINLEGLTLKEEILQNPYGNAYSRLKKIFGQYNEVYNSGLFAVGVDNDCDKIEITGEIVQKTIRLLYESDDNQYIYNFYWINADILGMVYEQYLGKILAQSRSGKSKLKNGQAHRKEQGIYYTPTRIVDYIVSNTLGELLKDKKIDKKKIKVLDPACGSGSFLIKAYDYLNANIYSEEEAKQTKLDGQGKYTIKTEILKNNIYGVDLDEKANEITKLNLLLKAAEKNRKLPDDDEMHIKRGNSLIDDDSLSDDESLKRTLYAFRWEEDFQAGTFDIVIGNPPYINAIELTKTVGEEIKDYWKKKYLFAKGAYDIYILFFEEALRICKDGGFVSFITPNKYLSSPYGEAMRGFISKNYTLVKIVDLSQVKVFDDPSVYPIITIFKKVKPAKEYSIIIEKIFTDDMKNKVVFDVSSKSLTALPNNLWGVLLSENIATIEKIFKKCKSLEEIAVVQATSTAGEADEYSNYISESVRGIPIINTGTIDRYSTTYGITKFMNKGEQLIKPTLDISKISEKRRELYKSPKIILAKLALRIEGFLDNVGGYASINTNCIHTPNEAYTLEYIAGVINSKLISFVYSELFAGLRMSGGYFQFQAPQIRIIPIAEASKSQQENVATLVKEIVSLNKQLNKFGDKKTADSARIEEEIKKIDAKIDGLAYEIYGITAPERKIIEESLKKVGIE